MSMSRLSLHLSFVLSMLTSVALAATPLVPLRDDEVIEVLPSIARNRPAAAPATQVPPDPLQSAKAAQQAITLARNTGDNRYWGRAQSVLAPWWDQPNAPADLAVLQATVQQGRHEFAASRKVLVAALTRQPGHAQGWLNLAALERLSANYGPSLAACQAVARAGQAFYAQACALETQSLLGQHALAQPALEKLAAQASSTGQQSWLLSLLAESYERAGQDGRAATAYQRSLSAHPDLYTAIAFSDLLRRTGKSAEALKALADYPDTDAVVLRRAISLRAAGDERWRPLHTALQQRVADLKRRGDNLALHGRELAMSALWLEDDPGYALVLARQNLLLQREPVDWLVAVIAAQSSHDQPVLAELVEQVGKSGLKDQRLEAAARRIPLHMQSRAKP